MRGSASQANALPGDRMTLPPSVGWSIASSSGSTARASRSRARAVAAANRSCGSLILAASASAAAVRRSSTSLDGRLAHSSSGSSRPAMASSSPPGRWTLRRARRVPRVECPIGRQSSRRAPPRLPSVADQRQHPERFIEPASAAARIWRARSASASPSMQAEQNAGSAESRFRIAGKSSRRRQERTRVRSRTCGKGRQPRSCSAGREPSFRRSAVWLCRKLSHQCFGTTSDSTTSSLRSDPGAAGRPGSAAAA